MLKKVSNRQKIVENFPACNELNIECKTYMDNDILVTLIPKRCMEVIGQDLDKQF